LNWTIIVNVERQLVSFIDQHARWTEIAGVDNSGRTRKTWVDVAGVDNEGACGMGIDIAEVDRKGG